MTLKFDEWPPITIRHLFCTSSSFVLHFKSTGEFKRELQSGNAQFGSKVAIFLSRVTLKFDGWPWKTIGHLFYTTLSFVQHFKAICIFRLELQSGKVNSGTNWRFFAPCDIENWWITKKNNRAPLLYYVKLCASLQIHRWSKTWVTVRKRSIRVKIGDFLSRVTLTFDGWPWKTIGHLFCTTLSFVQHFKAIGIFELDLQSGNVQFG